MAPLGATHDLLARALVLVVFTGGALALLAVVLLRRRPVVPDTEPPGPLAGLAGAGFAGVVAGALALSLGGPGALVWLALASLVGAAIQLAERRSRPDLSETPGPIGQAYRVAHALAAVLAALAAGALLLAQQGAEAARAAFPL